MHFESIAITVVERDRWYCAESELNYNNDVRCFSESLPLSLFRFDQITIVRIWNARGSNFFRSHGNRERLWHASILSRHRGLPNYQTIIQLDWRHGHNYYRSQCSCIYIRTVPAHATSIPWMRPSYRWCMESMRPARTRPKFRGQPNLSALHFNKTQPNYYQF